LRQLWRFINALVDAATRRVAAVYLQFGVSFALLYGVNFPLRLLGLICPSRAD